MAFQFGACNIRGLYFNIMHLQIKFVVERNQMITKLMAHFHLSFSFKTWPFKQIVVNSFKTSDSHEL